MDISTKEEQSYYNASFLCEKFTGTIQAEVSEDFLQLPINSRTEQKFAAQIQALPAL